MKWTKEKLEQMISDRVEENSQLDYKRAASLSKSSDPKNPKDRKAELIKDVTAFANASGGVLIYGIAEFNDREKCYLPERLDPIRRSEISKEWIDQIIQTIQPRLDGCVVEAVPIDEEKNTVCYVVEIPQSSTAHQARDKVYYQRQNFINVPMEDYQVRDVMNRKSHPKINVSAQFKIYSPPNSDGTAGALIFTLTNDSDQLARYVKLVVNTPLKFGKNFLLYENDTLAEEEDGVSLRLVYSNHLGAPFFPREQRKSLFKFKVGIYSKQFEKYSENIRYVVYADTMPKISGVFRLDDILERD